MNAEFEWPDLALLYHHRTDWLWHGFRKVAGKSATAAWCLEALDQEGRWRACCNWKEVV